MATIRVNLKERSYNITIGLGLLEKAGNILRGLDIGKDAVIITNNLLLGLYGKRLRQSLLAQGISVKCEVVPDSERAKSSDVAFKLIKKIAEYDKKKSLFIIAFGGGVVGDVAGFVAGIYKRGIPYVQIPTTLLGQVDSAIGGKTAIDLPLAKNLVGVFYQPKAVISDVALLETLSARQISNGLAEIIKYGIIKDAGLFRFLEKNYSRILLHDTAAICYAIERSSVIKAKFVESDEFDTRKIRAALNYGHTIGHAIEAASSYSSKYNHGESVAIGMIVAADISLRLKILPKKDAVRIKALIHKAGLPTNIVDLNPRKVYDTLLHDKKFVRGITRLVLPLSIGRVRIVDGIPEAVIKKAIAKNIKNTFF